MPDTKISALSATTSISVNSVYVPIVQANETKKATVAQITSAVSAAVAALSAQHTSLAGSVAGTLSAIGANSAQMTSADNAISNAVSIVSNAVSVVSAAQAITSAAVTSVNAVVSNRTSAITTNSAQMTSADNAISNAVSVVSQAVSNEISNRTSADAALSLRVNSVAGKSLGALSGISIGVLSDTQVLKWDSVQGKWINATDATVGGVSVTSAELASAHQSLSATDVSLMSAISVESAARAAADISVMSAVSVNSAQMTSADNAISNATSIVSAALAALSTANSVAHTSIMSAISVNSLQMTSADNAISNTLSIAAQKVSAGIGLSVQFRRLAAATNISAAALTNIPSMSVSMEAGGAYIVEGAIIYNRLVSGTHGFGFSGPSLAATGGYLQIAGDSAFGQSTPGVNAQLALSTFAGQTVVFSISATAATAMQAITFNGMFNVSGTGGTWQLMAKGSTAGTIALTLQSGFIRAYRIA